MLSMFILLALLLLCVPVGVDGLVVVPVGVDVVVVVVVAVVVVVVADVVDVSLACVYVGTFYC